MINLNGSDVKEFWRAMCDVNKTHMVLKADNFEMSAVASVLKAMGIMSYEKFMENYSTTIADRIFIPFTPGDDRDGKHQLENQVYVCVHEHVHVRQFRDKPVMFLLRYAGNSAKRTGYEIEAMRAGMEVLYFITGKCPDPKRIADTLSNYGCSKADVKVANVALSKAAKIISSGGVIDPISRSAMSMLKEITKG